MKRVNNLFDKIISTENLTQAINEVNRSHRWASIGIPNKKVLWIECTKEERVKELRDLIVNGFNATEPKIKKKYDRNAKKWRTIHEPLLWPDQYVHHALIQALEPIMMRGMDPWCCGSIKDRGAIYGIRALKRWMRTDKNGTNYCVALDIHHFYDSLDPKIVIQRFRSLIKDHRTIDLIERVMKHGVCIGAYFSQWFANTTLQPLDHLIRESGLDITHYIRYIDNIMFFSNRKRHARKMIIIVEKWLNDHGLKLNANKQCFKTDKRLPDALGYRYGRGYTLIRKNRLLAIKRQIIKYDKRKNIHQSISIKMAQSLLSRIGGLTHCNCFNIRRKWIKKGMLKDLKQIVSNYQKSHPYIPWEYYVENAKWQNGGN